MSRNPLIEPRRGEGKRWATTMYTASKEVEEALIEEPQDIGAMRLDMWNRKMSNTKTSISFGNENVKYMSDAMEHQREAGASKSPAERAAEKARQKAMKAALTTTSFTLGDEKVYYESSNAEGMRTAAEAAKGYTKISMNKDLKEAVKKSSLHFGNEKAEYKSVMSDCMTYHGNNNNFAQTKADVEVLKKNLRKHNFTLGDEPVKYETDYASGYGKMNPEHYKKGNERDEIKKQIDEIRKCHFSLGNEQVEYKSDCHRNFESILNHEPSDIAALLKKSHDLKTALQKTTITIGNDDEYL
jgi:hypothetical protein